MSNVTSGYKLNIYLIRREQVDTLVCFFCEARYYLNLVLASLFVFISTQASAQIQFQDVTTTAGGPYHTGESWGASWGHMDEDVYPDLFVSNHAMLSSILRNNGDGTFDERIAVSDLESILLSEPDADVHGAAWADFDNDRDQDLFITRSSEGSRFYLFENDGQGFFEEKGGFYGIGGNGSGRMPVLFDYTNDGRLDVVYAKAGGESIIFKWDTNTFIEDTANTGLMGNCNGASSGFASDIFNTGNLNFICLSETGFPYAAFDTSTIPFSDISSSIDSFGTNSDSILADFNNDLKMDVFSLRGLVRPSGVKRISNQRIEAWMNVSAPYGILAEKTIKFSATGPITISVYARSVGQADAIIIGASEYSPTSLPVTLDPSDTNNWGNAINHDQFAVYIEYDEVAEEWSITLSNGSQGVYEGAYLVVNGADFSTPSISNTSAIDGALQPTFLLNDGTSLVDSSNRGIEAIMCGGIAAADFDNDMDVDLYLTCRTSIENTENRLYLNDGAGIFTYDSSMTGATGIVGAGIDSGAGTAEIAITADFDIDGFMDLFVTNGNRLFPHIVKDGITGGGPDKLYRNLTANNNHWLLLDLEGVTSNKDGFGAKVIVSAGGVSQLREQNGQYHRWSHDHKRLHFGLGVNTIVDITIEWPDGTTDVHTSIAADKLYRAIQSDTLVDITPDSSLPAISIESKSVDEGDSVTLNVSLSAPSALPITIDYKTVGITATEGVDFNSASNSLTFAPLEITKPLTFTTLNNVELEANETFVVSLYNSNGSTISQSAGIVTIEEDGGLACGEPVANSNSEAGLFIWRDCGATDQWFVRATAGGGSTTYYEGDFIASNSFTSVHAFSFEGLDSFSLSNSDKNLDFDVSMANAGQDGLDIDLPVGSDLCLNLDDPNLNIFVGKDKVLFQSTVNLVDFTNTCADGLPTLSVADITISEAAGSVDVTVSMSNASANVVSVAYATSDNTATAGFDYTSVSGVVDIQPNDTSAVITVPILQDSDVESLENFTLTLSNSVNADILNSVASVSIDDDELTACGEPSYSSSTEVGMFVWQDCGATDQWFVRATAGGGSTTFYEGDLIASNSFASVQAFSFEGLDSFSLSNSDKNLDFDVSMANAGQDGLDIDLPIGSELCLNLNDPNLVIYVGVDKIPFLSTVNLVDLTKICP